MEAISTHDLNSNAPKVTMLSRNQLMMDPNGASLLSMLIQIKGPHHQDEEASILLHRQEMKDRRPYLAMVKVMYGLTTIMLPVTHNGDTHQPRRSLKHQAILTSLLQTHLAEGHRITRILVSGRELQQKT